MVIQTIVLNKKQSINDSFLSPYFFW